jgi:hypothetical protein
MIRNFHFAWLTDLHPLSFSQKSRQERVADDALMDMFQLLQLYGCSADERGAL